MRLELDLWKNWTGREETEILHLTGTESKSGREGEAEVEMETRSGEPLEVEMETGPVIVKEGEAEKGTGASIGFGEPFGTEIGTGSVLEKE